MINPRILVASGVGVALVAGAFMLSSPQAASGPDPRVEVVAGPAPERDFITVADEDGDGVADWKQTLPEKPGWLQGRNNTATSTGTTTRTHTETLAVTTLERMMTSNMSEGFGDNPDVITAQSDAYMQKLATDELFGEEDITTSSDTSDTALRVYGNRVAAITFENGVAKEVENELTILDKALKAGDDTALADLELIADSYAGMVDDMRDVPVPETYAKEHLDLLNAYHAMAVDIRAFGQAFTDPIYALARLQRYKDDGYGLYYALSNLYLKLHDAGIEWSEDDMVSDLIRIENR